MNPLSFEARDRSPGRPEGWDDELDGECVALDIMDHTDLLSGANIMYSLWRPTPEELGALLAGGAVRLGIFGVQHPVVNLAVLEKEHLEPLGVSTPG